MTQTREHTASTVGGPPTRPYEDLTVSVVGRVGVVRMDRPPLNTTRPRTLVEVHRAVADLDSMPDVHAIVLTGNGEVFLRGADLKDPAILDPDRVRRERREAREELEMYPWRSLLQCSKPIIAGVDGDVVGVGAGLVLKCDVRIVSSSARFGWVFTRRGMIPEVGAHWLLPRLIGHARAIELLLSGRLVDADEAQRIGLASQVVAPGQAEAAALDYAEQLVSTASPLSLRLTKRLALAALEDSSYGRLTRAETEAFHWAVEHGDTSEGIAAFMAKRTPQWSAHERTGLPTFLPTLGDSGPDFAG